MLFGIHYNDKIDKGCRNIISSGGGESKASLIMVLVESKCRTIIVMDVKGLDRGLIEPKALSGMGISKNGLI